MHQYTRFCIIHQRFDLVHYCRYISLDLQGGYYAVEVISSSVMCFHASFRRAPSSYTNVDSSTEAADKGNWGVGMGEKGNMEHCESDGTACNNRCATSYGAPQSESTSRLVAALRARLAY